jgi:23S rRNA (uridine2552-2'-O)-methyltransferase
MPMARSKSSKRWLKEHFDDPWVKRAQQEGQRSRAFFKLEEIDQREQLLRAGMFVVDLGAAPGGWTEYAARQVGPEGRVVAVDLLPMEAVPGAEFILGDFREQEVLQALDAVLGARPLDLVLSDLSPNMSGVATADQARASYLGELAVDFAATRLNPGGDLVVKLFQGAGFEEILRDLRQRFDRVNMRKPEASRARSPEVYAVGRGFRG